MYHQDLWRSIGMSEESIASWIAVGAWNACVTAVIAACCRS